MSNATLSQATRQAVSLPPPLDDRELSTRTPPGVSLRRSEKITDEHLQRRAIVYVRQSTQQQVLEHRESTARQYALVDRAVALGWPAAAVEVIDEDQGHSGSSAEGRSGFQRLLAEISSDGVGLILGLEMSRLARSCKDWHVLLELCAIYRTLLADADGLYDPGAYNDRLLLGLKGTMSEAELHILKSRLQQGMWNKAERGDVLNHAPIGYVRTPAGDYVLDPDEQAQAVVRLVFEQFRQRGSVNGLLRWFVAHQVKLPVRPHFGVHRGELQWRRPNRVTLLNMLHHPIYAGAYRWGHRQVDPRKKRAGRPGTGRTLQAYDACRVLIRDRFPAYIAWEEFEENQRKLADNSTLGKALSAPRHGPSVLAGLVVCGRCDQHMLVGYSNASTSRTLRYNCLRAAIDYGEEMCQSLSGAALESFVSERLADRQVASDFSQADETRWLVFVEREGKQGYRWWLWVFLSDEVVVFRLDPSRSHEVPERHFPKEATLVLMVDRYSAYKAMVQVKQGGIVLVFCWALAVESDAGAACLASWSGSPIAPSESLHSSLELDVTCSFFFVGRYCARNDRNFNPASTLVRHTKPFVYRMASDGNRLMEPFGSRKRPLVRWLLPERTHRAVLGRLHPSTGIGSHLLPGPRTRGERAGAMDRSSVAGARNGQHARARRRGSVASGGR